MFESFDIMSKGDLDLLNSVFEKHEKVREKVLDFGHKRNAYFIENNLEDYMYFLFKTIDSFDYVEDKDLSKNDNVKALADYIYSLYDKLSEEVQGVFDNFFEGIEYWKEKNG